jgi:hypothetical protein
MGRKIDHHDGILFHDANKQNDADDRDDIEVNFEEHESEHGSHARRRQRGDDGERMNQAFV